MYISSTNAFYSYSYFCRTVHNVDVIRPILTVGLCGADTPNNTDDLRRWLGVTKSMSWVSHCLLHECRSECGTWMGVPDNITSLDLSHNNISILHQDDFWDMQSFQVLHQDHNHIQELRPGIFSNMTGLTTLSHINNALTALDFLWIIVTTSRYQW